MKKQSLVHHATDQTALNDISALLHLAESGKLRVTGKTGIPSRTCIRVIREVLYEGDFYPYNPENPDADDVQIGFMGIRPFAWVILLRASNMVKIMGTRLEITRTGKSWMKKPSHETLAFIWNRWIRTKIFHELRRIDLIKGQKSKKRPVYAAESSRQAIAHTLSGLKEGKVITVEDFYRFIISTGNSFDVVRNPFGLYIGDSRYGNLGYAHASRSILNRRFTLVFLLEYAATLGVIDVALAPPGGALKDYRDLRGVDHVPCLSRYDGLKTLRLNSLGTWILGKKNRYRKVFLDKPSLHIQANLEIISTNENMPVKDKLLLDRLCDKISERTWRLNKSRILAMAETGYDLSNIFTFLNNNCHGDLPQTVNVFLEDILHSTGKLQDMGEARLVKCSNRNLALLLTNDSRLKNLCKYVEEDYLVISKKNLKKFRTRLKKLGYSLNLEKS